MIDIVICDDSALHNQTLVYHLTHSVSDLPIGIGFVTTNGAEVIEYAKKVKDGNRIYMLDLVLEQKYSGLDLCDAVHRYDPRAYVIYVSAYPEYALECVQSHAFDFVLKPYTPERLEECIKAAVKSMLQLPCLYEVTVRIGSRIEKLDQSQILYVEAKHDYVTAFMETGKLSWRERLGQLEKRLNSAWFERMHKSFLVNTRHVASFDLNAQEAILDNGAAIAMSRKYASGLRKNRGAEL